MENKKLITDPSVLGGPAWMFIHLKAKLAVDDISKRIFINEMYFHYNNFPCINCRKHIQEYMETHPFEPFYNMTNSFGKEIGMFKWSWIFHNTVNMRLWKPYLDWETACEMYDINDNNFTPCTDCEGNNQINNFVDKTKIVQGYFSKNNKN